MYDCPTCQTELTRRQHERGGVYWACSACGGKAVGLGLLRKLVDVKYISQLWRLAIEECGGKRRRCPMCGEMMSEVMPAPDAPKLDVCRKCPLVWFDPGEFASAPSAPTPVGQDAGLPPAVKEKLAILRIEDERRKVDQAMTSPEEIWKNLPGFMGLPVEFDSADVFVRPIATWTIAAVIVAVSVWGFFDLNAVVKAYGFIPAQPWRLDGLTWITSFFIHGGLLHLVGNVYFLLIFGDNVEERLGVCKYLLLIALSTVCGDMLHLLFEHRSALPSIGASGGISGVLAFYALSFPKARLGVFFRFPYTLMYQWIKIPAAAAFAVWILLQAYGTYEQIRGMSNISSLAHIGGVAVGVLFWLAWRGARKRDEQELVA